MHIEGWTHTLNRFALVGANMGISERMGDVLGQAVESKLLKEVIDHPVKVTHLAIIMDGNRRFAWKSKIATGLGHRIGKQKLETVLDWVLELEIPWFTVYALSTENLSRPKKELDVLFKLYIEGLKDISDAERIKLALRTDQPSYVQYFYLRRNILKVKIQLPNNQDIYAVNIHASAFATDNTKEKQMAKYKEVLDNLDNLGEYFVTGGDLNSLPPNANIIDFCEVDKCEGEIIHNDLDGGPHLEGSYFNNFDGESDLLTPFYNSYFPAIDPSLINNFEHLTHSTWNTNYNTLESESWSRKLDYLFTNIQNWTSTGNTDNSILKISDHAPVTANIYFNE